MNLEDSECVGCKSTQRNTKSSPPSNLMSKYLLTRLLTLFSYSIKLPRETSRKKAYFSNHARAKNGKDVRACVPLMGFGVGFPSPSSYSSSSSYESNNLILLYYFCSYCFTCSGLPTMHVWRSSTEMILFVRLSRYLAGSEPPRIDG